MGNNLLSNGSHFLLIENRNQIDFHVEFHCAMYRDTAARSLGSKIPTPVRAAVSNQRPTILTPSPAFVRSCGDIETHFLRTGSHLS
jgi:hypothetical protein